MVITNVCLINLTVIYHIILKYVLYMIHFVISCTHGK